MSNINPSPAPSGHRVARFPGLLRRVLLPLAVVFTVLAASGWITSGEPGAPDVRTERLTAWNRDSIGGADLPSVASPPERIAVFFASMGHRKWMLLAERHPEVVGNLDGAPAEVRYAANRHALARARELERERVDDDRLSVAGRHHAGRLANRYGSLLREDRRILSFDPSGGGRAAEVFGDLDTARRISVVVPGVDTDLLTFERTRMRYRSPVGMAEALHAEQSATDPDGASAVIAWADYTTPRGVGVSAATGELAAEGAERLVRAVEGLPGDAPVALFCHSYGSVVCGLAAERLSDRVTDIVVAGSPGMRVSRADRLGTDARVWATRATGDWIRDVPHLSVGPIGHGTDPVHPSFGALPVASGTARGHTGYFEPGSDSLRNFARIGTGLITSVT
ncbi:alpha/beta hydrolase [Streptomyces sp. ST2-7A]|uniref:alpha/beta hydrolase n=1 Tax=Streptomyces sp. ST2-7A TaxID=2907214 RepID=UPI001F21E4B6|nr:alpha/beta hydrolase [Streptomyces sp. ST2-7A]MCE7082648.1 alpha/beta hydrolase family protein [Streptomyces sp. ST2-7A]